MARQPLLDSPTKNHFIGCVLAGKSIRRAAKDHNIPPTTANDLFHKYKETGSTHRRSGSGRLSTVTPRVEHHLKYLAVKFRRMPFGELSKLVEPKISASTVWRVLNQAGYHRRKAWKVIYLKPEQKAVRLQWAKDHKDWKAEDWAWVIYSDEAYVVLGESKGTIYVTRTADEVYHDDCIILKYKQSDLRVMVWGCILKGLKGPMVILDYPGGSGGGMTAARYQEQVLDHVLHDFYQQMCEEWGQVLFQQDGASSHTAKSTTAWLDRNQIERIRHPAASPDVNPIEPVWHDLKELIRACKHIPTTLKELKEAVKEAWDQVPIAKIDKYVTSMEERVQAVIKAKGGHTPF